MQTGKRIVPMLWLVTLPLLAQNGQQPSMQMGMKMESTSPTHLAEPTPELLPGVAARTPLKLEYFLDLADRNNPTLRQAAAIVRRSEAQASQASLYPNPTVGYEGDQIRGGSYGGGEQGGFVAQTIVLGGKLGLRRDIYEQQKQSDTIAAEAQLLRVHNDVTRMFYNALSAQQAFMVRGRLLGLANDAAVTAHQLANVGQADAPDVLQSEVEAEQAGIDYTVAQRMFIQSSRALPRLPAALRSRSLFWMPRSTRRQRLIPARPWIRSCSRAQQ